MPDLPQREILPSAQLDAAWLPTRDRLAQEDREEGLRIRVHRSLRALSQAEEIEAGSDSSSALDAAFVFRWVALNALYGQWDDERGMAMKDRVALDRFTSQARLVDTSDRLVSALETVSDDARTLLESPFLIERFWRDQEWDQVRPARGRAAKFRGEIREERQGAALHRLLIAVYFLRCQIVHGGATLGSNMNRVTVEPGSRILAVLCGQLIALVVEHGLEMEWGEICYPPVRERTEG